MIDTILFDLMGVLLFPKENRETNLLRDEIDSLVGGATNDVAFKEKVINDHKLTEAEFNRLLTSIVEKYEPYPPIWNTLAELRKKYKLGIINDGTYLTYPFFEEKYHFSHEFDGFFSSAIEGVCKPDARIFLQACRRLGSPPDHCLFMDDSKENIIGAQKLGMRTIHWRDRDAGFREFSEFIWSHGKGLPGLRVPN